MRWVFYLLQEHNVHSCLTCLPGHTGTLHQRCFLAFWCPNRLVLRNCYILGAGLSICFCRTSVVPIRLFFHAAEVFLNSSPALPHTNHFPKFSFICKLAKNLFFPIDHVINMYIEQYWSHYRSPGNVTTSWFWAGFCTTDHHLLSPTVQWTVHIIVHFSSLQSNY